MEGIRVRESGMESVVFEAELFEKPQLSKVLTSILMGSLSVIFQVRSVLDGMGVKVAGWAEPFRVSCRYVAVSFSHSKLKMRKCKL